MEVYKRDRSKSWYVDLTHPVTKKRIRKSLRFQGTKVLALKLAGELQQEWEKKVRKPKVGRQPITLGAAIEQYVASLEVTGKVAAKGHRYRMERLLGRATRASGKHTLDPSMKLHDLTPAVMETLALARAKEGKKPQTVKHELSLIRSASRYVASLGFSTPEAMTRGEFRNPWRVPRVGQKTRHLSPDQYAQVHAYLDPERLVVGRAGRGSRTDPYRLPDHLRIARQESQDLLVALAYTGARWSEIAHLTWEEVDFANDRIRIWAGKVEKERLVPIADALRDVLLRRVKVNHGLSNPLGLVFPGHGGRPRTTPAAGIRVAMDAVGLNRPDIVNKLGKATIHSLRHTFASWLIQNGANLAEVMNTLGHSSVTSTTRYAHLSNGPLMTKIGAILN